MLSNWTHETSTSTGTGNFTLSGAATDMRTIASRFAIGERFSAQIVHVGAAELEAGIYYLSDSVTLVRETVLDSSNGGALVNFSAGTKQVFVASHAFTQPIPATGINNGFWGSYLVRSAHLCASNQSNQTATVDRLYYHPFKLDFSGIFDALTCRVITAAGTPSNKVMMAMYSRGSGGEPSKRVTPSVTVDPSTTGIKAGSFSPISLPAGYYWAAIWCDASAIFSGPQYATYSTPAFFGVNSSYMDITHAYRTDSALTELPLSAGLPTNESTNSGYPMIMLRATA